MTFTPAMSRGEALAALRDAFAGAGLDDAGLDARLLVQAALDLTAAALLARPEARLGPEGAERLGAMARRRLAREPVDRILGGREFWGLRFALSPDTLAPRPDTETLVDAVLAEHPDPEASLRVLDLGTGSGCLLLAVLSERPRAWGVGLDRSPGALLTARANARALGLAGRCAFLAADWSTAVRGSFDVVLSNPPYIPHGDMAGLAPEVARHDPRAALDGGPDGLGAYRAIVPALPRLLSRGGSAVLELGVGQDGAVRRLGEASGLKVAGVRRDLAGRTRAIVLRAIAG